MFDTAAADANLIRIEEEMRRFWQWYGVPRLLRSSRQGAAPIRILVQPFEPAYLSWRDQVRIMATADLLARYHAMRGCDVRVRSGWIGYGLPVELLAERSLPATADGYDLTSFAAACRQAATNEVARAETWAERLAVWLDANDTFTTPSAATVGAVWGVLRRLWDAGLLAQEEAVASVCPRCATALSAEEASRHVTERSAQAVWVRLPWVGEPDTYFLAWTPAPWMLLGMVALAVHPDGEYILVEWQETPELAPLRLVIAESALQRTVPDNAKVLKRVPVKALRSAHYRPLFTFQPSEEGTSPVVLSPQVPLDQGTGLLPVTPSFHGPSLAIARAYDLPLPRLLDEWGILDEAAAHFRGLPPLEAEPHVVDDLRMRGLLFRAEATTRPRAHCPYCATPLLPQARSIWKVTLADGEWVIGRDQSWGVPLPVWTCEQCGARVCVAGLDDLAHRSALEAERIDPHRPAVDRLALACPSCTGQMRRAREVVDSNFVAAVLPWAGAPPSDPADLAVGLEGQQGWLSGTNSLALQIAGSPAWRRAVTLSESRTSKGWDPDRLALSDALRWAAYTDSTPAKAERAFLRPLWRLAMALHSGHEPQASQPGTETAADAEFDRWLRARLCQATDILTEALAAPDPHRAASELAELVTAIEAWYLPNRPGGGSEAVPLLCRLVAPFVPHMAESIHRMEAARAAESVHLSRWPTIDRSWEDQNLLAVMALAQRLALLGQTLREHSGIEPDRPVPRALIGLLRSEPLAGEQLAAFQAVLSRVLRAEQVQVVPGIPASLVCRLSLDRERAVPRSVSADEIAAPLGNLDPPEAARLAEKLWDGFSVSVEVGGQAITLLPEEVQVALQPRVGWAAWVEGGYIVTLESQGGPTEFTLGG